MKSKLIDHSNAQLIEAAENSSNEACKALARKKLKEATQAMASSLVKG